MRRVFLLLSACLVMSLMFAPAAGAQATFPQSDGSGATLGDACPAGEFGAIPAGSLGEEGFACFDTLEEAEYYAETGQLLPAEQTAPTAPTTQYDDNGAGGGVTNLPDTGGFPLGGIAASAGAFLISGGLLLRLRLS